MQHEHKMTSIAETFFFKLGYSPFIYFFQRKMLISLQQTMAAKGVEHARKLPRDPSHMSQIGTNAMT